MLHTPRTSVVIPAYNHERFIGEALASLQAQTQPDFEAVVVDDGSSDATAALAREFARRDDRFRVIGQENRGSHAAINRGVSEARAGWIAILNSDDRYARTRLERLHEAASAGARFVVTDARLIDENGDEITDREHWWHRAVADFQARCDERGPVEGLMYGNFTVSTSNFFFERSLFDEVGAFRPLRRVLDWDWALRAAMDHRSRFLRLRGEPLLDYRLHGSNAILADPMRGTVEIGRVHRSVLAALGVPQTLLASIQRNRRELRRGWRDRDVAKAERFVREREGEIASLQREIVDAHAQVVDAHAQVVDAHAQVVDARAQASDAVSKASAAQLEAQVAQSQLESAHATIAELEQRIGILRARLDHIEGSLPWRVMSRLKRLVRGDRG